MKNQASPQSATQSHWRPPPSATEKHLVNRLKRVVSFALNESTLADFDELLDYVGVHRKDVIYPLAKAVAEKFRTDLRQGLEDIARGEAWKLPSEGLASLRATVTRKDNVRYECDDPTGMPLRWRAVELILVNQHWRVSRCAREKCGRLFVRTGRSEYHDARCASAVRSSKYYSQKTLRQAGVTKADIGKAQKSLAKTPKRKES